jgi:hypothetical protein
MKNTAIRFTVKETNTFGMLSGYKIWDSKEKTFCGYDFDEDEKDRANSKCELKNILHKINE